jgi:hypothetical protein
VALFLALNLVFVAGTVIGDGTGFSSTTDFDAGTKSSPGDGALEVETRTDNPAIADGTLELASSRGDGFTLDDADADTFKWDIPASCVERSPTTIVRHITGGEMFIGSNKAGGSSRVGAVQSTPVAGDLDVRLQVREVSTQSASEFTFSLLNERRCYWKNSPVTVDGVQYQWTEGPLDAAFSLRAILIQDTRETVCGTVSVASSSPTFLRIARTGSTWTWYHSADGSAWTQDEQCTFAVLGPLYPSVMEKDERSGAATVFAVDNVVVVAGLVAAGGFRTSGDWTSPVFDIPSGQAIDHIHVVGSFDATFALDRSEIRKGGSIVEAFETDNTVLITPTHRICGSGISVRIYLRGNGAGTPVVSDVLFSFATAGFTVTSETIALGASTGFGDECGSDDLRDTKSETVDGITGTRSPDSETVALGSVAGDGPPSPSDVDASDDLSIRYTEGTLLADTTTPADAQSASAAEFDEGSFPRCLAQDDGDACTWSEAATVVESTHYPISSAMSSGTQTSGMFPGGIGASDDAYIEYRETLTPAVVGTPSEPASGADLGDTLSDNTRTVWRNPRGLQRYYVLYEAVAVTDLVYRTSPDGDMWSAPITISTNTPNNFEIAIQDTGADLKVFLVVVEGTSIRYRRGSIADTSETIVWDADQPVTTVTKSLSRAQTASIARTESGRLVIAYTSDITFEGNLYRTTRLIGSNGDGAAPAWGSSILLHDPSGFTNNRNKDLVIHTMAAYGPSFPDRVLVASHVADPVDTSHYRFVSAAVDWAGSAFVGATPTAMRSGVDPPDAISCVVDDTEIAHCLVEEASDLFSVRSSSPGDDLWEPFILAVPPERESGRSTLSIDRSASPDILYAIYDKSLVNLDLFYITSPTDAIAWSSEVRIPYAEDISDVGSAIRDYAGGIHVIGQRATDVLFYVEIAVAKTTTQEYAPASATILKGSTAADDIGPLYKQGTFARKTDGLGLQTVSGIGFEGKALLLWWTRQAAPGTTAGLSSGIGFVASASEQYSVAWADDDNAVPSNSGRRSAAAAITILGSGTPVLDGEARFVAFTADGWTLDWTANPNPASATIVHFIVLGPAVTDAFVGQFAGPASGAIGNRAYTGVGFRGDVAFFLGSLQTGLGDATGGTVGFGVASGPANRAAISLGIPDGTTTADNEVVQDNRRALIMYNPALSEPTTDQLMDLVSFDADGLTLNHLKATSGNIAFWTMVVKGGTYKVDSLVRPTSTGDQHVTGVGFRPEGVLFFGSASTISFGSEDAGAEFSLGAGSQTPFGIEEGVTWGGANDRVTPTNANMHTSTTKVLKDLSLSSQAVQNEAEYRSSDPDGFSITWTAFQSSTSQKWLWLAIGGPSTGAVFPPCVQASDDVRCEYSETDQGTGTYEVEVRYGWTGVDTAGTEWRLFVEGRQGTGTAEAIRVRVYAGDDATLSSVVCSIASTSDATYDCGILTSDQLDGGSPGILFADAVNSGDGSESRFELDRAFIQRTFSTRNLDVRYDWSGIPAGVGEYELRVEGNRGDENLLVQVLTPPATWTTRAAVSSTVDTEVAYVLTAAEFNGGAPAVRFVDGTTPDAVVSTFRLDHVRIVARTETYAFGLGWEWTASIAPNTPTLEIRAAVAGDSEAIVLQVWDWQDLGWRDAATIVGSAEAAYVVSLAALCDTGVDSDCEVSTPAPGSVRVRFLDLSGADSTETSLVVDVGVVRTLDALVYALEVRYDWSLPSLSARDDLRVEGRVGTESVVVEAWDWVAGTWTGLFTLTSNSDESLVHTLAASEISSTLAVRIRFTGSLETAADTAASALWLDYVAIEQHGYALDLVNEVSGASGPGTAVLRLEGRLASAGENFDVYVWNWTASSWTLWLAAPFGTSDLTFERALDASETEAGAARVRFVDEGLPSDGIPSSLEIDLLDVRMVS